MKPLRDSVIVKAITVERSAFLKMPDSVKERELGRGEVVATGTSPDLAVGDLILFKAYDTDAIEVEGEEYLVVERSGILAKMEEVGKIKGSTKERDRIDVIQPYDHKGRKNSKFEKFYGDPREIGKNVTADKIPKLDPEKQSWKKGKKTIHH